MLPVVRTKAQKQWEHRESRGWACLGEKRGRNSTGGALQAIVKTLVFIPKAVGNTEAFEGGRGTVGFVILEVYSA